MQALTFNEPTGKLELVKNYLVPVPKEGEALIKVLIAQICSTDLELVRGYVPGFAHILGHEFVGRVERCESQPELEGKRVVGEINCNDGRFCCADAVFQRNHAPGRSVLGIINRDGCMAEYMTLPAKNLHIVPDGISDTEAAFAEPLAAACRILEQGLPKPGSDVAVIGDGKLGLLVAAVLAADGGSKITLLGRHSSKLALVQGLHRSVVLPAQPVLGADCEDPLAQLEGQFSFVVEASGSQAGILAALRLARPMGTLLLKSTVSVSTDGGVPWAQVANDIVVNEKVLVGSRCGPMDVSLRTMEQHAGIRQLLASMVSSVFPFDEAVEAMKEAQRKGVLKVQLRVSL